MPGFMPDTSGHDSHEPINDVAVLEDTNGDGVMDKRTVFADRLLLPRAIKTLDGGAALVGEPSVEPRAAGPAVVDLVRDSEARLRKRRRDEDRDGECDER